MSGVIDGKTDGEDFLFKVDSILNISVRTNYLELSESNACKNLHLAVHLLLWKSLKV